MGGGGKDVQFLYARKRRYISNYFQQCNKIVKTNISHRDSHSNYTIIQTCGTSTNDIENPCTRRNSVCINVYKTRRRNKNTKFKIISTTKNEVTILVYSLSSKMDKMESCSMPDLNENKLYTIKMDRSHKSVRKNLFNRNLIVGNCCKVCLRPECNVEPECNNPFMISSIPARVYRCQLSSKEETCCCNCNSDAMFEVMKSLYDCYKKKNCNNCNCILCGLGSMKMEADETKAAGLLTPLEGKTKDQKEKHLKSLVEAGLPIPELKTTSDKKILDKVKTEILKEKKAKEGIEKKAKEETEKKPKEKKEKKLKEDKEKKPKEEIEKKAKAEGLLTPLEGKSRDRREKILRGLAKLGIPFPPLKTASDRLLAEKVRKDMGLPPEPKTDKEKQHLNRGYNAGIISPLDGKSHDDKEKILKKLFDAKVTLPEPRNASEKAIIDKLKASKTKSVTSSRFRDAKAQGLLTPLEGKPRDRREKILRGLATLGLPFPVAKTASDKELVSKVIKEMGLPPEPKTDAEKKMLENGYTAGIISPLEGKSLPEKEKLLKNLAAAGVTLPEGRTQSEKVLINRIKNEVPRITSERLNKARAEGLLTPLEGKPHAQREKILRGLANLGLPLPVAKTASDKKIAAKVRKEMGLPPEPKTDAEKKHLAKAYDADIVTPLEGKSHADKEKILKKLANAGVPLPEGRTASEKALIKKLKQAGPTIPTSVTAVKIPSEKMSKAKAQGLLTPLEGKPRDRKERILKGRALLGLPFPPLTTSSDQKLGNKVRKEMGLPPEPKTDAEKKLMDKGYAAGLIIPLEGESHADKEKILEQLQKAGISLPEPRNASEKAIIDKLKAQTSPSARPSEKDRKLSSEKMRKAKAEGLLTPLEGKPRAQKEKILRGLANLGLPLPVAKTASDKKLTEKIRKDMGLPPEPKTDAEGKKLKDAYNADLVAPLEGKSHADKEKILNKLVGAGVTLPEGRTPSEKALIKKLIEPAASAIKVPSEKLRKAKAQGFLTPLEGKPRDRREKIMRGLASLGLPFPPIKTSSDKQIADKVRKELGLPPEPKSDAEKKQLDKGYAKGIITPLEGKSHADKEKILKKIYDAGITLPEPRTDSEKKLIKKLVAVSPPSPTSISAMKISSEKLLKAKAQGLLTPLEGKPRDHKEKILKGLAALGLPLPPAKTTSDKKLHEKVRKEMGLPPEPKTDAEKMHLAKAYTAGIVSPLEGKSHADKEKVLKKLADAGVTLPQGRTASEKALIKKIIKGAPSVTKVTTKKKSETKETAPSAMKVSSEKLRKAKAQGLFTPLEGKPRDRREKIMKGLGLLGMPFPPLKTSSDKQIADKVRKELGLPPEPKNDTDRKQLEKGYAKGIITPLEGKSHAEKEKVLKKLADAGVTLPEGRTASEKALIKKLKETAPSVTKDSSKKIRESKETAPSAIKVSSEKLRKAKAQGLFTPLEGKPRDRKEKILRGLATLGIPLPEAKTASDKKLTAKVRKDMGIPPEPKTNEEKKLLEKGYEAGIISPLEGKTKADKEKILTKLANAGIPLPEGRTASEKALINKIKTEFSKPKKTKSEKLKEAKVAGLLTPLAGKTPQMKEKILRGLAQAGLPLPESKTPSEKKLIDKVIKDLGLPPEPTTSQGRNQLEKAVYDGIVTPLEGKTAAQKEKILERIAEAGLPLPEGRTSSEKALIAKLGDRKKLVAKGDKISKKKLGAKEAIKASAEADKLSKRTLGAKGAISEEIQEIVKTTKCDRACGCDKKKIKFKHSYVKIRVTSPDISSFCDCSNECLPGVKGGVFLDNEGIKVTVGRATGAITYTPSVPSAHIFAYGNDTTSSILDEDYVNDYILKNMYNYYNSTYKNQKLQYLKKFAANSVEPQLINREYCLRVPRRSHSESYISNCISYVSLRNNLRMSVSKINGIGSISTSTSIILVRSSESTVSSCYDSLGTISVISVTDDHTTDCIDVRSKYRIEVLETDDSDYYDSESAHSVDDIVSCNCSSKEYFNNKYHRNHTYFNQVVVLRLLENRKHDDGKEKQVKESTFKKLLKLGRISKHDTGVVQLVGEVLSEKPMSAKSSVFVLVPSNEYKKKFLLTDQHDNAPIMGVPAPSTNQKNISPGDEKTELTSEDDKRKKRKIKKRSRGCSPTRPRVILLPKVKNRCTLGITVTPERDGSAYGISQVDKNVSILENSVLTKAGRQSDVCTVASYNNKDRHSRGSPEEPRTKGVDTTCDRPCCCAARTEIDTYNKDDKSFQVMSCHKNLPVNLRSTVDSQSTYLIQAYQHSSRSCSCVGKSKNIEIASSMEFSQGRDSVCRCGSTEACRGSDDGREEFTYDSIRQQVTKVYDRTQMLLETLANMGNMANMDEALRAQQFCTTRKQTPPCINKQTNAASELDWGPQSEVDLQGLLFGNEYIITADDSNWAKRSENALQTSGLKFRIRGSNRSEANMNYSDVAIVNEDMYRQYGTPICGVRGSSSGSQDCAACGDNYCSGLGPSGQLPPIPTFRPDLYLIDVDSGSDWNTMEEKESPHPTCGCEPKEAFDKSLKQCSCTMWGAVCCNCEEEENKKRKKKKNIICECPVLEPEEPQKPAAPKGFKLSMDAKGSSKDVKKTLVLSAEEQ